MPPKVTLKGPGQLLSLKLAEETGQKFIEELGAPSIDAARSIPVDRILDASKGSAGNFRFWAVLDGDVLRGPNYELYQAGRFNDTPILIGFNSDDRDTDVPPVATSKSFEAMLLDLGPAACSSESAWLSRTILPRGSIVIESGSCHATIESGCDVPAGLLAYAEAQDPL